MSIVKCKLSGKFKEVINTFKLGWIVWVIAAMMTFGFGIVPSELKVFNQYGYTGTSVPNILEIPLLVFLVGWPFYGWATYERKY